MAHEGRDAWHESKAAGYIVSLFENVCWCPADLVFPFFFLSSDDPDGVPNIQGESFSLN